MSQAGVHCTGGSPGVIQVITSLFSREEKIQARTKYVINIVTIKVHSYTGLSLSEVCVVAVVVRGAAKVLPQPLGRAYPWTHFRYF